MVVWVNSGPPVFVARMTDFQLTTTHVANLQEAGTSSAGGGSRNAHVHEHGASLRASSAPGRPPNPQAGTGRNPQIIAVKDGDHIPEGYTIAVQTRDEPEQGGRTPRGVVRDTVDLSTPPKATEVGSAEGPDTAKSRTKARRNLTRNTNRKANATFAKELKDSLASGQPTTIKVAEDQNDLKAAWHAAAKELGYKFLDLTKESWKEYTFHEKNTIHTELNEQYKFNPPIDPKRIDKYLSGHLRASRAVWKAHWKKYGPSQRHHNCPQAVWTKLCLWWPTTACREEAVEMASRRARVEKISTVGRSSLHDRMDKTPSVDPPVSDVHMDTCSYFICNARMQ